MLKLSDSVAYALLEAIIVCNPETNWQMRPLRTLETLVEAGIGANLRDDSFEALDYIMRERNSKIELARHMSNNYVRLWDQLREQRNSMTNVPDP